MPDRILIRGLRVHARHGVHEAEREVGGWFVVDLTVETDLREAGTSDRLEATVDYGALIREVRDVVAGETHGLIESVAERVAAVALARPRVTSATVRVTKTRLPFDAPVDGVAVEIERRR